MSFHGKNGMCLHMISAYRPQCKPEPYSPYQQHLQYLTSEGIDKDPLIVYDEDLCRLIKTYITAKDQVILMIDANTDLTKTKEGTLRGKLQGIGLIESVFTRHYPVTPPATCTPGKKNDRQHLLHCFNGNSSVWLQPLLTIH